MRTLHLIVTLLCLSAPSVTAGGGTWVAGEGPGEPNTPYDHSALMWSFANDGSGGAVSRIYFNGFLIHYPGTSTRVEEGAIATNAVRVAAYLGYWRDCNGDGYVGARAIPGQASSSIGHWNTGAYPADLAPPDPVLCPPGSAYNTGIFIDEFRWIGPDATPDATHETADPRACTQLTIRAIVQSCLRSSPDLHDVPDADARVWADFGPPTPRARPPTAAGPSEAFDDSGSTLTFVDAATGAKSAFEDERRVRVAGVDAHEGSLLEPGTWDGLPSLGGCGSSPRFLGGPPVAEDAPIGTCGLYPLWQAKRLVNDSNGNGDPATPIVYAFDTENDDDGSGSACDDTVLPAGFKMAELEPRLADDPLMHGSLGGTAENAYSGTGGGLADGRCRDSSSPSVGDERAIPAGKTSIDAELAFHPDTRYQGLAFVGLENVPLDALGVLGGPASVAGHVNLPGGKEIPLTGGPRWISPRGFILVDTPPGATEPFHVTQYADVSPESFTTDGQPATALPAGAQDAHEYGREACGGNYDDTSANRAPNALNWVCSRAVWESHQLKDPQRTTHVLIGSAFDLRDVDCYDLTTGGGARDDGVRTPEPAERALRESCRSGL